MGKKKKSNVLDILHGSPPIDKNPAWAQAIIYITLAFLGVLTVYPMINMLAISLSSPENIAKYPLMSLPRGLNISAYKYIFETNTLTQSFGITVYVTVLGTILNMIFTTLAAYGLSKTQIPGYKILMVIVVIPMFFGAGLIPQYMLYKNLNLLNNLWVMMIPGLISTYNMILIRNYFWSIPESIEESAILDGANDFTILLKVMIPLAKPVLATVSLFCAVGHWNDFFTALMFINDNTKWPLQVVLRSIIIDSNMLNMGSMSELDPSKMSVTPENIKAATIVFAMVPILLVYPYLQKYFVKGIMLGSVKG